MVRLIFETFLPQNFADLQEDILGVYEVFSWLLVLFEELSRKKGAGCLAIVPAPQDQLLELLLSLPTPFLHSTATVTK